MKVFISTYQPEDLKHLNSIFWETSAQKDFKSPQVKEDFQYKYLGFFLENYPKLCLVAKNEQGDVLGYICATLASATSELLTMHPHQKYFQGYYQDYPAELHINCSALAQGKGIGSLLLMKLEASLREMKVIGLHLKTSLNARNIGFYVKNGYSQVHIHENIVMFAKKLA
jgi:ribosomal protein S18 acetylase RimI-like enzyme